MQPLRLATLNTMDRAAFSTALGFVFEGPPWIVAESWDARPFADLPTLHRALCATMLAAPEAQQVALLQAHPDLAGKAAIAGELTAESTREQASAGLDRLTVEEFERFTRLNHAYSERFGFPFVICVREHDKHGILEAFETRLANTREQELAAALGEVGKIARLRLEERLVDETQSR